MENMIKKIKVKNFQCIKNAEIDLGKITVFFGKSRTGKSALFRAMKSVAENETGDEFITWGESETEVQIDDLKWIQSSTKNMYMLGSEKFEKCGVDVPEKIQKYLGMGKIEFGKDIKKNLNFIEQLKPIFMVQYRGSVNAKIIGSITNLGDIYNGLREAEKDTKNVKKGMNQIKEVVEHTEEQYKNRRKIFKKKEKIYKEIKGVLGDVKICKEDAKKLIGKKKLYKKINQDIKSIREKIEKCNNVLHKLRGIDFDIAKTVIVGQEFVKTKWKYGAIQEIFGRYKDIDIKKGINTLEGLKDLTKSESEVTEIKRKIKKEKKNIEKLDIDFDRCFAVLGDWEKIRSIRSDIKMLKIDIKSKVKDKNEMEKRIKKYAEIINEMDVCPECGAEKEHWHIGGVV